MCRLDTLPSEIKLQLHKSLKGFYFLENSICIKYTHLYTTKIEFLLTKGKFLKYSQPSLRQHFPMTLEMKNQFKIKLESLSSQPIQSPNKYLHYRFFFFSLQKVKLFPDTVSRGGETTHTWVAGPLIHSNFSSVGFGLVIRTKTFTGIQDTLLVFYHQLIDSKTSVYKPTILARSQSVICYISTQCSFLKKLFPLLKSTRSSRNFKETKLFKSHRT